MPENALPAIDSKVPDPELRAWISAGALERREVILEAVLPTRTVAFDSRSPRRSVPKDVVAGGAGRSESLEQLRTYLRGELGVDPTVLPAAGALVLEASGEQVRRVIDHPLLKAVRPNRLLRAHPPTLASR